MLAAVHAAGSSREIGFSHGRQAAGAIDDNLRLFWQAVKREGLEPETLLKELPRWEAELPLAQLEEILGIADGSGLPYPEMVAYNRLYATFFPDECSVIIAHGQAGKDGHTIFLKNSDKVGGVELQGEGFCYGKEINAFFYLRPAGQPAIMGVGAAGTTGFKFGCSDAGVATGANIARTRVLKQRQVDLTTVRAADRAQLCRDGLRFGTAREAALHIVDRISAAPMGTTGNLQFVDAGGAWFIEGSYDTYSLMVGRDDVFVRTNRFQVLHEMNDPDDLSSYCRYVRGSQLVQAQKGAVDAQAMIQFSMDHEHGPSLNSLCRHDAAVENETSLSAGVVDIDPADPKRTVFHFCVGKPCHAWRSPTGHRTLTFADDVAAIPDAFYSGQAWIDHYTESL